MQISRAQKIADACYRYLAMPVTAALPELLTLVGVGIVLGLVLGACTPAPPAIPGLSLSRVLGSSDGQQTDAYLRAIDPREFSFPADHGPHPGYRNEWWYLTGNLDSPQGRHFGYQLTFFNAVLPETYLPGGSAWESNTIWMAHFALTDVEAGVHSPSERFSRGSPGLAGATLQPLRVWLDDWQFSSNDNGESFQIQVKSAAATLMLTLDALKPPVLQGDAGLSQKSAEAGNASYYYSMTRLHSTGSILIDDTVIPVSGLSWLDREFSTSALGPDQSGWDWFALQLNDGTELMYYQLLDQSGRSHPYSAGSWTDTGAVQHPISPQELTLEPLNIWTSPAGVDYPVQWRLRWGQYDLQISALLDDQWMNLSIPYWEGAVQVREWESQQLIGYGYLEEVRESNSVQSGRR